MPATGEFINDTIIVTKSKDVGRLHGKSHFGKCISDNRLQLDLLEGIFLQSEDKLRIFHDGKELLFPELLTVAAQEIPDFEIKYLVFRDLRTRGHPIRIYQDDGYLMFSEMKPENGKTKKIPVYIAAFSERETLELEQIIDVIKKIDDLDGRLWFAIVDEEGDITYYDLAFVDLGGYVHEMEYPKGIGVLLKDRVVIFDTELSQYLRQQEFFGKPFGTGLQLSLVEALYLIEKQVITIHDSRGKMISYRNATQAIEKIQPDILQRLQVFTDLKHRGLAVKTGFKFGAHFRAYTKQPEETHAEYLVHVVEKGFQIVWAEMSRAVRLAHSVRKAIVFAQVDKKHIIYVWFGRLRP